MTDIPSTPSHQGAPLESGRGGVVLTLGILSLVLCALLGPFAWMMGKGDLAKMASGRMDTRDQGITKAGMICGIIGTIFLIIAVLFGLFALLTGFTAATY